MQIQQSHVVLDACCILNFCASGNFLEILQAISVQAVVTLVVQTDELETLRQLENQVNPGATQFESAITQGWLKTVDFESEQESADSLNARSCEALVGKNKPRSSSAQTGTQRNPH